MTNRIDVKEFAERVERVCDFFLSTIEKDGSSDRIVLEKLKDDAADIQFNVDSWKPVVIDGLDSHMRGMKKEK